MLKRNVHCNQLHLTYSAFFAYHNRQEYPEKYFQHYCTICIHSRWPLGDDVQQQHAADSILQIMLRQ